MAKLTYAERQELPSSESEANRNENKIAERKRREAMNEIMDESEASLGQAKSQRAKEAKHEVRESVRGGLVPEKMTNLRRIHARRSEKAQAIDEARGNAVTIQPGDQRVEGWRKDPGSADISGIDTKHKKAAKKIAKIPEENHQARHGAIAAEGIEVKKITGKFKNVVITKKGKPVVAVAELNPDNPNIDNRYLRTDSARQKPTVSTSPPTMHEDKGVQAVLKREFPVEKINSRHGNVTLTEVPARPNRRYNPMVKEYIGEMKRKRSGVDLGAGVVREGRKQHIKLE